MGFLKAHHDSGRAEVAENTMVDDMCGHAAAATRVVRVTSGVIRDGVALVEGESDPDLAGHLRLRAMSPDGLVVAEARIEPTPAAGPGAFSARLAMHGHAQPIMECVVDVEGSSALPSYAPCYQLRQLFYASPEAFEKSNVARKRNLRQPDNETQMFMARQMASMFSTELDRRRDEARLLMSCAFAYRATDVKSAGDAALAIALIDRFDEQLRSQPPSDLNGRRRTSLLNAKWHAAAIADDAAAFEKALVDILAMAEVMAHNDYIFIFHFNPVRSLCVLAGYSILIGDVNRARQCFAAIRGIMAGAARAMTFHPVHLQDFAKSCRIVTVMAFFEDEMAANTGGSGEALLMRPVPRLRATVGDAAVSHLIRPCIRSDNPEDVVAAVRRFVTATQ